MIQYVPHTGSTNADLAARLRDGEPLPEGHWLVTDRQSAGRGRQGRVWSDGLGNFMGSCVVRPGFGDPPAASLALLAGVALAEVIIPLLSAPDQAMLKWPNDLLVNGAKLAGILLESSGDAVIVGIGVNLASAPEFSDRKTIALADLGPTPARDIFAENLAHQFTLELERWRNFGLAPILRRWQAMAHPIGTALHIAESGLSGHYVGLTEQGALQLRLADGAVQIITAGDVMLTDRD